MSRSLTSVRLAGAFALFLAPFDPAAAPPAAMLPAESSRADRPEGDTAAVHVVVDTLAVDGKGTRIVGSDEADLVPGAAGVLEKSIPLMGRGQARPGETVRLKVRVTPLPSPPSGAACLLQIGIEASPGPESASGRGRTRPPEAASATLALDPGQERMIEAYASTVTEGKVALKLRCSPAASRAPSGEETRLVALNVTIERAAEGEPTELLRSQVLTAALAKSAITVAGANRSLPDGPDGDRRYRSERLEVTLSPILVVAGKLQIDVRVGGEVTTFSAGEDPVRHPVEASETFVVAPDEPRHLEVEVPSGGPEEGWSRVRFLVQVSGRF